jgi:hypothetical protein
LPQQRLERFDDNFIGQTDELIDNPLNNFLRISFYGLYLTCVRDGQSRNAACDSDHHVIVEHLIELLQHFGDDLAVLLVGVLR